MSNRGNEILPKDNKKCRLTYIQKPFLKKEVSYTHGYRYYSNNFPRGQVNTEIKDLTFDRVIKIIF
jgi:hypothetical protein